MADKPTPPTNTDAINRAARNGEDKEVRALLDAGSPVDAVTLHELAHVTNDPAILQEVIDKKPAGMDLNKHLISAVGGAKIKNVDLLIQNGAMVTNQTLKAHRKTREEYEELLKEPGAPKAEIENILNNLDIIHNKLLIQRSKYVDLNTTSPEREIGQLASPTLAAMQASKDRSIT
jgi:hypothetical protein